MWETFLLQMNDFERLLEHRLRQMLDPVVGQRPPRRRRGKRAAKPIVAVVPPSTIEFAPETIPVAAPVLHFNS